MAAISSMKRYSNRTSSAMDFILKHFYNVINEYETIKGKCVPLFQDCMSMQRKK